LLRASLVQAAVFCVLFCLCLPPVTAPAAAAGPLVVIDPGHGGIDPGAVNEAAGILEKTVNIEVGRRLARILESRGLRVRMTRGDDGLDSPCGDAGHAQRGPGLDERVDLANRLKADLFISLHANAFRDPRCSGVEIFYCPGSAAGERLADRFREAVSAGVAPTTCKVRPCDYYVLRQTTMPAVVVEMGYISNHREARLLSQPAYQERLARAFAQAVDSYLAGAAASGRP